MRAAAGVLLIAAAGLVGCGSGGNSRMAGANMSSAVTTGSATAVNSRTVCSNCGGSLVTLTDAPGDFLSYIVNLVSLQLTRDDGTSVQVVPASTQVDFARLVDLAEIVSAADIPAGAYSSVTFSLDYGNATIAVDGGAGPVTIAATNIINGATAKPLTKPNSSLVTLKLMLDPSKRLIIAPNTVANLALDFNLAASNTIGPSTRSPTTVTVNPVLTAKLVPDMSRELRVRGSFVSASTSGGDLVIGVRPFDAATGVNGQFTIDTNVSTSFTVNGSTSMGSAGFAQSSVLPAGTLISAYGTWDTNLQTFTAVSVLAGSSVAGGKFDRVLGTVVSRSGNRLVLADASIDSAGAGEKSKQMGFAAQREIAWFPDGSTAPFAAETGEELLVDHPTLATSSRDVVKIGSASLSVDPSGRIAQRLNGRWVSKAHAPCARWRSGGKSRTS
jgi:hypothetical protein